MCRARLVGFRVASAAVRRVSVVGNSGSGKSTVAAALALRLGVPHVELDAFKHQRDWVELPTDEFAARVRLAIAADGWVVDGNYSTVRDEVWQRADTVIWVDPPRTVLMGQIITRTLGRIVRQPNCGTATASAGRTSSGSIRRSR
jgi:adenylate kinase family enzyme